MRLISGFLASLSSLALGGCLYGFAGGGLPSHIKTVAVLPFDNQTPEPTLTQEVNSKVREAVEDRLGLRQASERQADAVVRGTITRYEPDVPVAFTGDAEGEGAVTVTRRLVQISVSVEILDQVPAVSRHYDAARIAAVRVHSEYLPAANGDGQPTAADFQEVVGRLPNLYLDQGEDDGDARRRLAAVAQEVALDRIRELGPAGLPRHGGTILGSPPTERWLRDKLADALPKLAQKALTADDHALLVDLGNAIRHRSLT